LPGAPTCWTCQTKQQSITVIQPSDPDFFTVHFLTHVRSVIPLRPIYKRHTIHFVPVMSRRYDSRVSFALGPTGQPASSLTRPQLAKLAWAWASKPSTTCNDLTRSRRPSSPQKAVSIRSNMPSKPSRTPAQQSAFSPKTESFSQPSGRSHPSY
jgi:hypothetical protein